MKKKTEKSVNYTIVVNTLNNQIPILESKNKSHKDILEYIQEEIKNSCILKPEDYESHLSSRSMVLLDTYSNNTNVTYSTILELVKLSLDYNPDITDRQKIINVFTYIEYYFNPKKFDMFKVNYKDLMKDSVGKNH